MKTKDYFKKSRQKLYIYFAVIAAVFLGILFLLAYKSWAISLLAIAISFGLLVAYVFARQRVQAYMRIRKMEEVFPDFIQLMASNLRAGITIDKALLMSSRKEFDPLDAEILRLGKDLMTGQEIDNAMISMAKRIKSEKISKTLNLIIAGVRSGGNLAVLLEETAVNMKQRGFVEKRAASNVLMYTIFVFFAVAIGAPVLFGLSSVLVQILTDLFATIPHVESQISLPLSFTKVNISVSFITYFSIVFILATNVLASLVLGLVGKGEEKEGVKYIIPMCLLSISIFFIVKYFLLGYFSGFFG
jgi:type II secretory pathway component PulF